MKSVLSSLRIFPLIICFALLVGAQPVQAGLYAQDRLPVSSPIELSFDIDCKDVASVQVVLDDEVKDIIARQIFVPDCEGKTRQTVQTRLYFDTFERLTPAHLSISAFDAQTRWIWMKSENIVFTDRKAVMPYTFESENPLSITAPRDDTPITERIFTVEGSVQVGNSRSAYFELVSDTGLVLGSALLNIPATARGSQYDYSFPFEITYPNYKGGARLVIQQFGLDIFGIESIASVYLQINP